MFSDINITEFMLRVPVILLALTVHEFSHAYFAYRMGDPTAYRLGRCTLNPIAHLDPLGTICLLFAPIGWAKPVPVNPLNFRDPRKGDLITSAAGPLSNVAQALVWALLLRGVWYLVVSTELMANEAAFETLLTLCWLGIVINVGLAVFNCLPLFPLDGYHITYQLSGSQVQQMMQQMAPFSPFIILGIVFLSNAGGVDIIGRLIYPPASWILYYVAGLPWEMANLAG